MDEVTRLADQLRYKAKDYCKKPDSSQAQQLQKSLEDFYDLTKTGQTPDKLTWEIKEVRQEIERLRSDEGIEVTYHIIDLDDMHDRCEDLRKILEQLN